MSATGSPGKDGLLEEAAAWFARMRGPQAEASREEFERWLARGALHRAAYNRAAEVFAMGKLLAGDCDHDAVATPGRKIPDRRLLIGAAAALLIVLPSTWLLLRSHATDPRFPTSIAGGSATPRELPQVTGSAEPQLIRLADDSRVRLDGGSAIAVQYSDAERRLLLERGSARFFVAHQQRPFVVFAGGGYVVAHGTVFDVGYSAAQRVTVRLIEGSVDVRPPALKTAHRRVSAPRRLVAGQTINFEAAQDVASGSLNAAPLQALPPVAGATAAREYDSIMLGDLLRIANESAKRPIRLADPRSAQLKVSGKFRVDDTDLLAERIAALFDMTIDRSNPAQIVLSRK